MNREGRVPESESPALCEMSMRFPKRRARFQKGHNLGLQGQDLTLSPAPGDSVSSGPCLFDRVWNLEHDPGSQT